jgi:aminotransferase
MNLPSGREMADIAAARGAVDMSQGVVHTIPPLVFVNEMRQIIGERQPHVYSSPAGLMPYREALRNLMRPEKPDLTTEMIIGTNGVTGGLAAALSSHCQAGERVLLPEPFYPAHDWVIRTLKLVPEYLPYYPEHKPSLATIAKILPRVSAVLLTNPANPTGMVWSKEELLGWHDICRRKKILLLVDEVYRDFIWEGRYASLLHLLDSLEGVVILRSFSKNLALSGWRVGFAISTEQRCQIMSRAHDAIFVGAPAAPQLVMAKLLRERRPELEMFVHRLVNLYANNRPEVARYFTAAGMEPYAGQGAYYMLVKHRRISDRAATEELLNLGIAVAPGASFFRPGAGNTGYLRVHFALSEENMGKVKSIITRAYNPNKTVHSPIPAANRGVLRPPIKV